MKKKVEVSSSHRKANLWGEKTFANSKLRKSQSPESILTDFIQISSSLPRDSQWTVVNFRQGTDDQEGLSSKCVETYLPLSFCLNVTCAPRHRCTIRSLGAKRVLLIRALTASGNEHLSELLPGAEIDLGQYIIEL